MPRGVADALPGRTEPSSNPQRRVDIRGQVDGAGSPGAAARLSGTCRHTQPLREKMMLTHPNCHLGDSWYHVEDDIVHCWYLVCPDDVERHTAWDIAHATSTDLIDWDLQGVVVERGAEDAWDSDCLATGSVVKHNGNYVMAYTAKWNDLDAATGIAYSSDLSTWTKSANNPATRPGGTLIPDLLRFPTAVFQRDRRRPGIQTGSRHLRHGRPECSGAIQLRTEGTNHRLGPSGSDLRRPSRSPRRNGVPHRNRVARARA